MIGVIPSPLVLIELYVANSLSPSTGLEKTRRLSFSPSLVQLFLERLEPSRIYFWKNVRPDDGLAHFYLFIYFFLVVCPIVIMQTKP